MANPSVRLKNGGVLLLSPSPERPTRYLVQSQGQVSPVVLARARGVVDEYEYGGPAEGYPGYALARTVAEVVGGEAILPPLPPKREGIVE